MLRISRLLTVLILVLFVSLLTLPASAQQQTHTVQPGENLFRIALSYGLSTAELAAANNITNTSQIYSGQVLVIPMPGSTAAPAAPPLAATGTHVVARGEKLGEIARRYGMSLTEISSLNGISNPNLIFVGQVLTVNTTSSPAAPPNNDAPAPAAPPPAAQTTHIVQRGEYLSQIAARYGVSWVAIAQANNIASPDRVYAGTQLIIPAPGTVATVDYNAYSTPAAPTGIGREILVDLSDSRIYAFENGVLMRTTLASMGRAATPTVIGNFTVQRKYVTSDMSGPGYYLSGVPYTMYFYQGYAIHGTYWHSNWGTPMSRGCVNLPPSEAEWYFNFAPLGTPVRVQA
jgi:LysM repeat protein